MHPRNLPRLATLAAALLLAACATTPVPQGYYRVQRGDTLSQIARHNGTNTTDVARWNQISNPNAIEVGQVLRVVPPAGQAGGTGGAMGTSTVTGAPIRTVPLQEPGGRPAPAGRNSAQAAPAESGAGAPSTLVLVWPTRGAIVHRFGEAGNKGIDIGGEAGQPVFAAAAGKVVYAGNGLRGYGNLLIVKHNTDYLTAYAYNRKLLVKEGQAVTQGEQIAEMGSTDTDRVMLHFEVRRLGKTVNPMASLPPR